MYVHLIFYNKILDYFFTSLNEPERDQTVWTSEAQSGHTCP